MESAILVGHQELEELRELAVTAGARVIDEIVQHRDSPDPATYVGKGKVEEIRAQVLVEGVDVVIFDDELSPG
jgi:GTP-binding protein HflX